MLPLVQNKEGLNRNNGNRERKRSKERKKLKLSGDSFACYVTLSK